MMINNKDNVSSNKYMNNDKGDDDSYTGCTIISTTGVSFVLLNLEILRRNGVGIE